MEIAYNEKINKIYESIKKLTQEYNLCQSVRRKGVLKLSIDYLNAQCKFLEKIKGN